MISAIKPLTMSSDRVYLDNLYRTHYKALYSVAARIVGEDDAGDVVTNAMLSQFSLVPKLRTMQANELTAYLRKTVRNAAYKIFNAQKRRSVTELPLDQDLLFSLPFKKEPIEQLIEAEEFRSVCRAIGTLSEMDRRILYLRYAAQLNAKEIAELIGATGDAAVRQRISRARREVVELLKREEAAHE